MVQFLEKRTLPPFLANVKPDPPRVFPSPFTNEPANLRWLRNPELERRLAPVRKDRRFSNLGVAVVDLTRSSANPNYFGWLAFEGWNARTQRNTDSLPKIAAMYAAYQLRRSLLIAVAALKAKTPQDVLAEVTSAWAPIVETCIPEAEDDFPKLADIFDVTGSPGAWAVVFKGSFYHHIKLMIEHSNNASAAAVINGVGYTYLNGALAAKGLYDRNDGGGLWLGWNFGGRKWKPDPVGKTWTGANAESVARFLTLLETDRLVVEPNPLGFQSSNDDMRGLMGNNGSWLLDGLSKATNPTRPVSRSYHKVGVYKGPLNDCAVIDRFLPDYPTNIRYAAVCLGAGSAYTLYKLIVKIDDAILKSPTLTYE